MLALVGKAPAAASLRDLMLRVLLSPAAVPPAADPANRTNIVKARIDALERLGAWQGYLRLLVPQRAVMKQICLRQCEPASAQMQDSVLAIWIKLCHCPRWHAFFP